MLTDGGYFAALTVYLLAALLALWLMNRWLWRGLGVGMGLAISLPVAALLLTPAYIQPDAETFAPALIVAAFQWLSLGREAADHALRPLLLFTTVAAAVGLSIAMTLGWRHRTRGANAEHSSRT